ncbi:MAG: hypothetical protein H0W74_05925 [Sphingosinicella sp.]|nr:hypothetical protein [Sphingosinicella sp.]
MAHDVAQWFYHHVVAAYDLYAQERDSPSSGRFKHRRTAIEAAIALFHFLEHLPPIAKLTRKQMDGACPDFVLIANVANAAKHHQRSDAKAFVQSAADITETNFGTRYRDEDGEYTDARSAVLVKCADGVNRPLDPALTKVLNFWSSHLRDLGLVDYPARPIPGAPGAAMVTRRDARGLSLEALKGLDFTQSFVLQRFNPDKGFAEPVDLTGADIQFRVYKPAYYLDIAVTLPAHGATFNVAMDLDDAEAADWRNTQSEADRECFKQALMERRQEEFGRKLVEALQAAEEPT